MIDTDRLIIRPFCQSDLSQVERLLGSQDVMRFSDHGALAPAACQQWLYQAVASTERDAQFGVFAIVLKAGSGAIGYVSLLAGAAYLEKGEVEVGIRLLPDHWGRGIASEAAQAVFSAASGARQDCIIAHVDPGNTSSIRLLERLGFVRRGEIMLPGYDHPDMVFARILADKAAG
ncbi:MAG: GNAT family N-acetyltransferase [Pseudomonadota bacterium]